MRTLTIESLRGGLNNTDPPISLADDQCTVATNVELLRSTIAERRRGADAIDLTGGDLASCDSIIWTFRHEPTSDPADAQLWALGKTGAHGGGTVTLAYKDTSWHTVTSTDSFVVDGQSEYQIEGVSFHGKLFLFFKSEIAFGPTPVDRLHVWDGTTLRRVGMTEMSTAPTAADSGGAGTLGTVRYYRVRETVQDSGTTILRSEPSDVLTFTPDGEHAAVTITKPTTVNTTAPIATHWELEASLDAANFFVIATTAIGTTTATDSTAAATGYTGFGEVSAIAGAYTPPHSAKHGIVDGDRLLLFGSWENEELESSVSWTPVSNASGVGNDERIPLDPVSTVNLDNFNDGAITDVASAVLGEIWVFKHARIYKGVRQGDLARAYTFTAMAQKRGALPQSVCEGIDASGGAAVFFVDLAVGPCVIARSGIRQCGQDVLATWETAAVKILGGVDKPWGLTSVFYPQAKQWLLFFGVSENNVPDDVGLVLHVDEMRDTPSGWRRGWTLRDGPSATVYSACLFSDNIDDDTDRNLTLKPFIGTSQASAAVIGMLDTGDDDFGVEYTAHITTKPYALDLQTAMEIKSATFIAKAVEDAQIVPSIIPDFGITTTKIADTVDFSPSGSEAHVTRRVDDLALADCTVAQVDITDVDTPGARWELARIALTVERGQGN